MVYGQLVAARSCCYRACTGHRRCDSECARLPNAVGTLILRFVLGATMLERQTRSVADSPFVFLRTECDFLMFPLSCPFTRASLFLFILSLSHLSVPFPLCSSTQSSCRSNWRNASAAEKASCATPRQSRHFLRGA